MDKYTVTVSTFNKRAKQYQDKYMDFDFYLDTYDRFCELVPKVKAHILDIGCGPGNIAKYLLKKRADYRIHGIDLAPKMIELAILNNPSASFDVMDIRSIIQLKNEYDAVICGFCTPYLSKKDVEHLINNVRGLLKKSGILYISTMEDIDARSGYQTSSSGDKVYTHYHQGEHFKKLLEKNNFEVLEVTRKAFPSGAEIPTTDMFIYAKAM
ncbi:class I SAM-dependent methyltransferase [Parashewanella spongiae]|uniref:Class I SAM-dependent methyltransferase n=1 Tax=Parashewanella spongiae TaxID=342950 RepID=A0A3A6TEH3_9GAMM|nr:class I SAM-dependent methyltransferase [Parashewanella spongiae]MCL1080121.1 class I SAM-dependent methyltransferase [Parashewanella spongiae]RJY05220.1 class I SAM-dependent methyltransferase [Parashewanella spongiae]